MNREQKAAAIAEIADEIQGSQAVYAVDYRGTSVPQAAELRTRLRDADTRFRVVKNTLTERAADAADAAPLKAYLEGPTALLFVRGDAAAAAKTLSDFRRVAGGQVLAFKGGWMGGSVLTPEEIESIARLPTRDVLYGRLVGMVASPLTGLVGAMGGLVGGLARQLQQMADDGLVGADAPATAPDASAVEPEAPAAEAEAPDEAPEAPAAPGSATPAEDPDSGPATTTEEPGPDPDPTPAPTETQED